MVKRHLSHFTPVAITQLISLRSPSTDLCLVLYQNNTHRDLVIIENVYTPVSWEHCAPHTHSHCHSLGPLCSPIMGHCIYTTVGKRHKVNQTEWPLKDKKNQLLETKQRASQLVMTLSARSPTSLSALLFPCKSYGHCAPHTPNHCHRLGALCSPITGHCIQLHHSGHCAKDTKST